MGTEKGVLSIKNGELQGIDYTADGVDDAACKKPSECGVGQDVPQRTEDSHAYPAHSNINDG